MSESSRGPERIGDIVGRLFAARGWGRHQERIRLERAWEVAVGPDYLGVTRVLGFKRTSLEVEVKGAVPLQELSQFYKRRILEKLRQELTGMTISDLRFKAGNW